VSEPDNVVVPSAALAAACQRERRYEFLFTSVPLNVASAVGSPANEVAIL
jgi:hypothetical protein